MQHPGSIYNLTSLQALPHWPAANRFTAPVKGAMEIGGLLNARNAAAADAQLRQQFQQAMPMDSHSAFTMSHAAVMGHSHQQHTLNHQGIGFPQMSQSSHPQLMQASFMAQTHGTAELDDSGKLKGEPAPKNFACSTCSKGFARRSDLARHERIHSGIRPHKCDYPGCGKEFIQRSALTVHSRTHTGEKPHLCERCSKPFSDSSSLARHRRIHSGKRPYKCPYANCQKTFTRRTTLTRHQNHHTGTIEQAAAETNAKLSATQPGQARSIDGSYSDAVSTVTSTASPSRPLSISPTHDLPAGAQMQRQGSDFQYLSQNHVLPPHMRNEYSTNVGRTATSLGPVHQPTYASLSQHRSAMTSHPSSYGPPQTLEPPTAGTGSGGASPHLNGMGWASPNNGGLPSPGGLEAYGYSDPSATYGAQALYYQGSNIRRPQSTEPEDYGLRSRHMGHHLGHHMQINTEWSPITNMHEIKQERAFAM